MWCLSHNFVGIASSLKAWDGVFSCLLPNVWQEDVAFALGNVQNPQSPTTGPLRPFRALPSDGQGAPLFQLASSWP